MPQNLVQPLIGFLIALIGIIVAVFAIPGVLPAGSAPSGSDQPAGSSTTITRPTSAPTTTPTTAPTATVTSAPTTTATSAPGTPVEGPMPTGISPSEPSVPAPPYVLPSEVFNATNAYRREHGLPELKMHGALANLAQDWSNTMAKENHLYHRPNFSSHYPEGWLKASENVLQNHSSATAQALVTQWHNSPTHRENMQDPTITHMGVGVAVSSDGTLYATQNFARY